MSEKYNGWANYETWLVSLWIDNDQDTHNYYMDLATETNSRNELAETIKNEIEENIPLEEASLYYDLIKAALSEVDWIEIADSYFYDNE